MNIELSVLEARVIGCLIEKQVTTPEQYPLSLNALQNACNQKSNREPVMELSQAQAQAVLDALAKRHLVLERAGFGSRVPKYQQRLCNTEFSALQLSAQERAVLCELLLRGPQTAGELRARAGRMASFADAAEVESALEALMQRASGALVRRLAREAGRREVRFAHLLGPAAADPDDGAAGGRPEADTLGAPATATAASLGERVTSLERALALLSAELAALKGRSGTP
jgi:uncharacterized protein